MGLLDRPRIGRASELPPSIERLVTVRLLTYLQREVLDRQQLADLAAAGRPSRPTPATTSTTGSTASSSGTRLASGSTGRPARTAASGACRLWPVWPTSSTRSSSRDDQSHLHRGTSLRRYPFRVVHQFEVRSDAANAAMTSG